MKWFYKNHSTKIDDVGDGKVLDVFVPVVATLGSREKNSRVCGMLNDSHVSRRRLIFFFKRYNLLSFLVPKTKVDIELIRFIQFST